MFGGVYALATFDLGGGPALYAGGNFTSAGGVPANYIAKWNGSNWSAVGAGTNGFVNTFAVADVAGGPALYVGGHFTTAGGVSAHSIAKWNGTVWSSLGAGTDLEVRALARFNDGSGSALYAGGFFTTAGGSSAKYIAKWNGTSWSQVGGGMDGIVYALNVFDDGHGPVLYAGGGFTYAGGVLVNHVAKWNGSTWSPVGGISSAVTAATNTDHSGVSTAGGSNGDSSATSSFVISNAFAASSNASTHADHRAAKLAITATDGDVSTASMQVATPFCFGDGLDAQTAPCPCANFGSPGHGCASSQVAEGALLSTQGTTVPDALVLHASGLVDGAVCIFLESDASTSVSGPFGDGVLCTADSATRLYVHEAIGGEASAPDVGEPALSARSAERGTSLTPGCMRAYQIVYRDATSAFCTRSGFNTTNAVLVRW
jgi:hypothetical protein